MTELKGPPSGAVGQYVRRRRVSLRLDERILAALIDKAAEKRRTLSAQVETELAHLIDQPARKAIDN